MTVDSVSSLVNGVIIRMILLVFALEMFFVCLWSHEWCDNKKTTAWVWSMSCCLWPHLGFMTSTRGVTHSHTFSHILLPHFLSHTIFHICCHITQNSRTIVGPMCASLFTYTTVDGRAREIYILDFRRPGRSLFYVGTIQKPSSTSS